MLVWVVLMHREKNYEKEDLTDKELERRIQSINRRRASYYEYYTGQKWGDRIRCRNS